MSKLMSRKLWATVAGVALVTLGQQLGLPDGVYQNVVNLIVTYIAGQAVVDAASTLKKP